MPPTGWMTTLFFIFEESLRLGFSLRVIARRLPVGVSLAWLTVILIFPVFGAAVYLLVGENRLGLKRHKRIQAIQRQWNHLINSAFPAQRMDICSNFPETVGLARLAKKVMNAPVLAGNTIELISDTEQVFDAIIRDIEGAKQSCDCEFYIWSEGGRVTEVESALLRAAARGVVCRVMVDSIGSGPFLAGTRIATLRTGGIQITGALPTGIFTAPFVRPDLRLHRKIVTIDGRIGYTGSMNMADPRYFKKSAGVGEWVDAMARIEGPTVQMLHGNFLSAWSIETGEPLDMPAWGRDMAAAGVCGGAEIQVLPSGPSTTPEAIEQVLLTAIYAANRELILTTPYFVPSESLMTALVSAAAAGVEVTLIVPAKVDSRLVACASQAFQRDLVAAGIRVALFDGGLLHTKSITVDGHLSLFGSLNLDPRSLKLNFELTLAIYSEDFTLSLRALQLQYLADSRMMLPDDPDRRSHAAQFLENTVRLLSPVL